VSNVRNRTIHTRRVGRHQVSSPPPFDAIGEDIKALVEQGHLRWTDPHRTIDDYLDDEPLPVELTDKPLSPPTVMVTKDQGALEPGSSVPDTLRPAKRCQEAELRRFFGFCYLVGVFGTVEGIVWLSPR
jgi:hypothetical protein